MGLKKAILILILTCLICGGVIYYSVLKAKEIEKNIPKISPPPEWIEVKEAAETLRLKVVPYESAVDAFKEWKPLADYLTEKLREKMGWKVDLKVGKDYRSIINEVGMGVIDLAILETPTFLEARKDFCVIPITAPLWQKGKENKCLLISRNDLAVYSIQDIKKRSFAYGDEKSLCGTLIPHKWMIENKITYNEDLGKVYYFSNYDAILEALSNAQFEVGGVMESVFLKKEWPNLKVIASSEPIQDFILVANFDLETPLVEEIGKIISEMPAEIAKKINPNLEGFKKVSDEEYEQLRKLIKETHGLDYFLPTPDFCTKKPKCKLAPKK